MPLFKCDTCGCVENTALGHYWTRDWEDMWGGTPYLGKALCSACGPTEFKDGTKTGYGKWHGRFEKRLCLPHKKVKLEKQESRRIKYQALLWLRLQQRCAFIATEVGSYSSDALGINEKKMIEVEVKTTAEDLRNDFKKHKHRQYYKTERDTIDLTSKNRWVPTHFYFAVPAALVETAKALIEQKGYTPYGVINADTWAVERRAKWIHERPPCSEVKYIVALRMGSELIRFHEAWI